MAVGSLFLFFALLSTLPPLAPAAVLNGSVTRHLRLHTSVANQFDLKRDGISIRTASRPIQWAHLRMPPEQQQQQQSHPNEANATSAVNSVLSQIVKSSMSDMLQKLMKSVQEVLQKFMRDPNKRLPDFLQVNKSEKVNISDSRRTSEKKTSVSEDQFWALVFQRMMNVNETNATTIAPSVSSSTGADVAIPWDSASRSNSTLQLSFVEESEDEKENGKSQTPEIPAETEDDFVSENKPAPIELQVPSTPVHLSNDSWEDFDLSSINFDDVEINDESEVEQRAPQSIEANLLLSSTTTSPTTNTSSEAEANIESEIDHQQTESNKVNQSLSSTSSSPTANASTFSTSTESSSSAHFSTKIASGNPFELVIRVETNEGQSQVKMKERKSENMIMPSVSTRRPPIPTSIETLITGEPFNMAEKVKNKDRLESNIVVADWLSPSDPPNPPAFYSTSSSSSATSLLSTVLIGVSAGFIIFIVASFGLMYACYGSGTSRNSHHKGNRMFCGGSGSMNFESGSCSEHRQGSPRDFGAAMVGPAPMPRRFLTRLNPCKPFYYQSPGSDRDCASSVANDRQIESTWTQASVLSDAMPTFDTADGGRVNPAADLTDSVVF